MHVITSSWLSMLLTENLVPASTRWYLPGGVSRLFPRRYVLFADVCHGCKYPSPDNLYNSTIDDNKNLELFFCLYAHHWDTPSQCNSTHSRLLGFFSTLPAIWRALQCLRRYYDTRNAFPHLVNCGKYTFTILCYMSLSLYRIDQTMQLKALFIACATVNSIYCCMFSFAPIFTCNANSMQRYGMLRWIGVWKF